MVLEVFQRTRKVLTWIWLTSARLGAPPIAAVLRLLLLLVLFQLLLMLAIVNHQLLLLAAEEVVARCGRHVHLLHRRCVFAKLHLLLLVLARHRRRPGQRGLRLSLDLLLLFVGIAVRQVGGRGRWLSDPVGRALLRHASLVLG